METLSPRHCLVWLNVSNIEVAFYMRRFLQYRAFLAQRQRLGKVVRVQPRGLSYYETGRREVMKLEWEDE